MPVQKKPGNLLYTPRNLHLLNQKKNFFQNFTSYLFDIDG